MCGVAVRLDLLVRAPVLLKVAGNSDSITVQVEAAPRLARSTRDRATLLDDLPPEVPLKIRVVPTNSAGDGIACEVMVERKAAA